MSVPTPESVQGMLKKTVKIREKLYVQVNIMNVIWRLGYC